MNTIRRLNEDFSGCNKKLSKSKSPECLRQKIPAFKPKKLQQIFQQSKGKRSTDSLDIRTSNKSKPTNNQKKEIIRNKSREKSPVKEQKAKNSLADFIKDSGHSFEVESVEFQNSQLDDKFDEFQFEQFHSQQRKSTQKLQFRVFTPQCQSFSKLIKQVNPFTCKDDNYLSNIDETKCTKYWNGQVTLATSMCQDDFNEDQGSGKVSIMSELRMFIDEKYSYVFCKNQVNGNELLLESSKVFSLDEVKGKLMELQKRSNRKQRSMKKEKWQKRIKIVSVEQMDEFLIKNLGENELQRQLSDLILPTNKFVSIIYKVSTSERPNHKVK